MVSYPAGLTAMPYRPFLLATAVGCAIWNLVVLLAGQAAGEHWTELFQRFRAPLLLVGVVIILAAVAYLALEHSLEKRFNQASGRP